jgi:hypothetical protein
MCRLIEKVTFTAGRSELAVTLHDNLGTILECTAHAATSWQGQQ